MSVVLGLAVVCFLLVADASALPPATPGEAEPVLARVGEVLLTVDDFEREWTRVARSATASASVEHQRRQLLDEMIGYRLRVVAARAAGLDRDPELVASFEKALVRRLDEKWIEETHKLRCLRLWGQAKDIGAAAVFLASTRANYITGQTISVSGGFGV